MNFFKKYTSKFVIMISIITQMSCSNITNTLDFEHRQHNLKSKQITSLNATSERGENIASLLNLKVNKKVLSNGLTILVYENHKLPIFSYFQFYNVGGRFEQDGTTGATHFLEHMMFKGSKHFKQGAFDKLIETAGGSNNAYTTFDNTVYYEKGPISIFDDVLKLESDRMQYLTLEKKSFENERQVVFSERKMRYENSPTGKLHLLTMKTIFKGTPYGGSVIGSKKDLTNLKRDNILDFYSKFYKPDHSIIVIAGDVDSQKVFLKIEKLFGKIQKTSVEINKFRQKMNNADRYKFAAKIPHLVTSYASNKDIIFTMVYPGFKAGSKESYVQDFLSMLADNGESYIYRKLVLSKRSLFRSLSVYSISKLSSGAFMINAKLMPKVSLKRATILFKKTFKRMCETQINDRNLQKVKNKFLIGYFNNIESNRGIASFLGEYQFFFNDFNYYKKELQIYRDLKKDDLKKACLQLVNSKRYSVIAVWNKFKKKQ